MAAVDRDRLFDHWAGSMIGLLTGDALGMPVEGWSPQKIESSFGRLTDLLPGRLPAGHYTDDFQMAQGLLESLIEAGGFDPARCAARWLANYQPQRGYGRRINGLMDRLAAGEDWSTVATDSFGNGTAMRVAPIGLWYAHDQAGLIEAAAASARITHLHPEAVAGAVVQAAAVGAALRAGLSRRAIDRPRFLANLVELAGAHDAGFADHLARLEEMPGGSDSRAREWLIDTYRRDVRAIEAVPPAVGVFLGTTGFEAALETAVNLGEDTDTLAAMTGAMAGAYYGFKAIPDRWLKGLENEPQAGRDYALELCRKAVANHLKSVS